MKPKRKTKNSGRDPEVTNNARRKNPDSKQNINVISKEVGLLHHDGSSSHALVDKAAEFLREIGLEVRYGVTSGEPRLLKKDLVPGKKALASVRELIATMLLPSQAADAGPSWYGCPDPAQALRRNPFGALLFTGDDEVVDGNDEDWDDEEDDGDY